MPDRKMPYYIDQFATCLSGAIVKTIFAPLDRTKLLLQTMNSNPKVLSGEVNPYKNAFDCCRRVAQEQGYRAFWRGNFPHCFRVVPQLAASFVTNRLIWAYSPRPKSTEYWKSLTWKLFAGGVSGAFAQLLCYPFDFARTRLASDLTSTKTFKGTYDCISTTIKHGGVPGLYRGLCVSLTAAFVYRGWQFGGFQHMVQTNSSLHVLFGVWSALVAATISQTAAGFCRYPFDTIRRRMMLDSEVAPSGRLYQNGRHCFKEIWKAEGVRGLYRGMGPEILQNVIALSFVLVYSAVKL
eukprot:TRINITY_DN52968_c0_g1_i1.p1 TRINITY_DN52968_c0_g1~~TRINITY_DN52968_c0_g1_i1.p1  ORF type:complete len:319 (+),score=-4.07 TRINITY_DN52968_c0_g1_i1:75-959(+)